MSYKLIDTHAHLTMDQFKEDRDAAIKRALEAGLEYIINIGSGIEDCRAAIKLAEEYPPVFAVVGIHPHGAEEINSDNLIELKAMTDHPKVVGIGETGLDYHYLNSPKDSQLKALRDFISIARELKMPLILHVREAHEDCLSILEKEGHFEGGGVVHCFSGGCEEVRRYLDLGLYISFTGVITFPKAQKTREVVKMIPMERILIETDSPYLTPIPYRGRRNEPAYVRYVADMIAGIKGLSHQDVARITTLNAKRFFNLPGINDVPEIAYPIRNSLYLNITNRCTNSCTFCAKFKSYTVKGHYLKLSQEPGLKEVMDAVGSHRDFKEVVFCGFGESLLRLDLVKEVAKRLKGMGIRVRIDTDGLANLVYGRDIIPELKGIVDAVSISLNAPDMETYERYCKSKFGKDAYKAVKEFIIRAKGEIPEVTATVVAIPGLDIDACRKVAEEELKVRFRAREYNEVG